MRACRARRDVPLVARRGRNRKDELIQKLGLDPARPLGLVYLGRDGMDGIAWERLKALDLQLISYAPPAEAESMMRAIPEDLIDHVDAASSVDVAIAKSGYGMCGECITAGTPLIYPPRPMFAEMTAVDELMNAGAAASRSPRRTSARSTGALISIAFCKTACNSIRSIAPAAPSAPARSRNHGKA
jgi:hypothetical protein